MGEEMGCWCHNIFFGGGGVVNKLGNFTPP